MMTVVWCLFSGCYQPAGPLIPMSPGWDSQKAGQPALQPLVSPGSAVQPVTCQTMITSSSAVSAAHSHHEMCEDGNQAPATSRPTAEPIPARPQKMVSPGSVEIGVGTHSTEKKSSSRSRSFHSSIRPSDKSRNPAGSVPIGAAHLVVADQERELDLSQKGNNGYSSAGGASAAVTTHESIIKPAIGVVHDTSHAAVATCSSAMSQIGHLERFVRGLVSSRSGSPVRLAPQIESRAPESSEMESSLPDFSKTAPKRKPEQLEESAVDRQSLSPKKAKYTVADEECHSDVEGSFRDEVQPSCIDTEEPECKIDSLQNSNGASAGVAVKEDSITEKDKNCVFLLPDVVSAPLQSSEDEQVQPVVDEDLNQPEEIVVESRESCELVSDDTSSNAATSSEKDYVPSPSKETPDTEVVGNPKSKDKDATVETVDSKQRASPVRGKNIMEVNKKRTQTSVSMQEKKSQRVGTVQPSEKSGRRSAEEGSTRSSSARRKRDTGGWEWYGDPEQKPVYFKVICLPVNIYV